ncbi:hypothetical protein DYGSA30_45770 [Dyella sp. GSA-30]|nr:hypothetical protein DYGSA30_45770 [Dyella sp. GSA-30]
MYTGHGPGRRAEQALEIFDPPAADQGERTAQRGMQLRQQRRQRLADMDPFGPIGKVDKAAVDIEKQRPGFVGYRQGRRR